MVESKTIYTNHNHSASLMGNFVMLFGGSTKFFAVTNDFYCFNSRTFEMKKIENVKGFFPCKRQGHQSTVIGK